MSLVGTIRVAVRRRLYQVALNTDDPDRLRLTRYRLMVRARGLKLVGLTRCASGLQPWTSEVGDSVAFRRAAGLGQRRLG